MGDLGRALCLMPSAAVIIYRSSGPRDRNALKGQTGTPAGCRGATLQGRCRVAAVAAHGVIRTQGGVLR